MAISLSNIKPTPGLANETSQLYQLVYISQCVDALSTNELMTLLSATHHFNQNANISGALLYNQNLFFQVLEGEQHTVNTLFANRITHDKRHKNVKCFFQRPIEKRYFPRWNMGFYGDNEGNGNLCNLQENEIETIKTFFQQKIVQNFNALANYYKATNAN